MAPISIDSMLAAHEKQIKKDAPQATKLLVSIHDTLFQNVYDTKIEENEKYITYTTEYAVDIKKNTMSLNGKKLRVLSIEQAREVISQDMKRIYDESLQDVLGESSVSIDFNPKEIYWMATSIVTLKKPKLL